MSTAELRKAAVLLLSLPRHQAADLLDQLDPVQVESLTDRAVQPTPGHAR